MVVYKNDGHMTPPPHHRCFSQIGRSGGEQIISIGAACTTKGIVMHEIFHALGRWHEQSRPDRDQFVEINYSNIESGEYTWYKNTSIVIMFFVCS